MVGMPHLDTAIDRAWPLIQRAIDDHRIPGAVLGLAEAGGGHVLRHGGMAQIRPEASVMQEDTLFDLASLTKPVFTTTALLRQVEQGRVGLDDPLASVIPDLRQYDVAQAPERRLTLRQCLAHQTHLPAVEPLYTRVHDPATMRAYVLQNAWRAGPAVYSDINFLLAGIALERLTGHTLADHKLAPGFSFHPNPLDCAATEFCTWRGRVMRGVVHDENAFAMGGASGHAGLFGSARALLDYAMGLLLGTGLGPESLAAIRTVVHADRTVGWQVPTPGWHGGDRASPETIGHTGFTGTGLWIDFHRGVTWTLLTNRVHPSRHTDSGIAELRRGVGQAVLAG